MGNYKQCNTTNYKQGRLSDIVYIVYHFTANNGDTAKNNADYFANNKNLGASAHYFVDENTVWQSVPEKDTAWHCGGGLQGSCGHSFFGKCNNSNSVGIEMCSRKRADGTYYIPEETLKRAAALGRDIMQRRNVGIDCVIRHYDVTGKMCPAPLIDEGEWKRFKNMIVYKEEIKMFPDVKKDDYGYKEIEKLLRAGIVQGDEHGNFNPDKPITRRDMAIMIARTLTFIGQ